MFVISMSFISNSLFYQTNRERSQLSSTDDHTHWSSISHPGCNPGLLGTSQGILPQTSLLVRHQLDSFLNVVLDMGPITAYFIVSDGVLVALVVAVARSFNLFRSIVLVIKFV